MSKWTVITAGQGEEADQVPIADGAGGYAWETPSAGAVGGAIAGATPSTILEVDGSGNLRSGVASSSVVTGVSPSAVQIGPRASGGVAAPYLRDFVTANDFENVDPTGATECSAALNTALAGFAGGYFWMDGTYKISSSLVVGTETWLISSAGNTTLDFSAVSTAFTAVTVTGTIDTSGPTPIALSGNASQGDTTLTTASTTGFSDSDHIIVYSGAVTGSTNIKKGEQCRLNTASTMTLEDPLCDSYATSDSASVAKVAPLLNVGFVGLNFKGIPETQVSGGVPLIAGIYAIAVRNLAIKDCTFQYCHNYSASLQAVWYAHISGCHVSDAMASGTGYGFEMINATQDVTVVNCTGERMRHLTTHSGATGSALYTYGVARRCVTVGCAVSQSLEDGGFDCHPGPEDISFIGCSSFGSGLSGVTHQGSSGVIANCTFREGLSHGVLVQFCSVKPGHFVISGNKISRFADSGIICQAVSSGYAPLSVTITGNAIDTTSTNGAIYCDGTVQTWTGCTITGNSVTGIASHGIYVRSLTGLTVSGNNVQCTGANTSGIYSAGNQSGTITGNYVTMAGATSFGMRVDLGTGSSANMTITGNTVLATSSGIYVDTVTGVTCNDNNVTITTASVSGIYIRGVTGGTTLGNYVSSGSNSGTIGIRVDSGSTSVASTNVAVSSNTATGAATGILAGSTTTGCSFTSNVLAGNTAAVSMSTGGNLWANNTPGGIATVASATSITLPGSENDVYKISGTTSITTIVATGMTGRVAKLVFTSTAGLGTGGNISLGSGFTASANQMVVLTCDGTNWYGAVAA